MNNKGKKPSLLKALIIYVLIFVVVAGLITLISGGSLFGGGDARDIEFSELVDYLDKGQVSEILINENSRSYTAKLKSGEVVIAYAPTAYEMLAVSEKYIIPQSSSGGLVVKSVKPSNYAGVLSWIPTIIMIILMVILLRNMMGGGGNAGVMNFGKSRARMTKGDDKKRITFAEVAGLEEEKQELAEIVDFLKNPKKYLELGARIPKGVLLVGPPGTGKTYISKAVAGEAGVPFFSISGSDFVEMFVGVGASRVRDLFNDAKKNAPCIVFIDEIDAVGRRRGAGIGGGNDEREQTLNQLLVEMDGFDANEGIIVMAATNRPDVLDPAILRPGRFDRQVTISTPDVKGREEVFKLYAKNKPLDEEVDLRVLAKRTPGFTPADIENMMNEAALLTARRNGTIIHMEDLEEAITRVIAGPKKRSRVMNEKELRNTAYHEAGHAIVMRATPGSDPVHQVTIMPRGMALGFTMQLPEEDRYSIYKTEMYHDIMHLLGGRIAEQLVFGDYTTGASNDLERATKMAHDMVTKYGMSEAIGPVNYSDSDEVFLGRDFTSKQNYSEELASKIDQEVRRIIDAAYAEAEQLIKDHRAELDRVAEALLQMETLDGDQFEAIYTGTKTVADLQDEDSVKSKARKEVEDAEAEARARREAEEMLLSSELEDAINGKDYKRPPVRTRIARIDKNGRISVVGGEKRPESPTEHPKAEDVRADEVGEFQTPESPEEILAARKRPQIAEMPASEEKETTAVEEENKQEEVGDNE